MPKCDFNKVPWVFSCKFAAYFQNSFSEKDLWRVASTHNMWVYDLLKVVGDD